MLNLSLRTHLHYSNDDTRHWAPTILDGYVFYGRPQKPRRTDTRAHPTLSPMLFEGQADSQQTQQVCLFRDDTE